MTFRIIMHFVGHICTNELKIKVIAGLDQRAIVYAAPCFSLSDIQTFPHSTLVDFLLMLARFCGAVGPGQTG